MWKTINGGIQMNENIFLEKNWYALFDDFKGDPRYIKIKAVEDLYRKYTHTAVVPASEDVDYTNIEDLTPDRDDFLFHVKLGLYPYWRYYIKAPRAIPRFGTDKDPELTYLDERTNPLTNIYNNNRFMLVSWEKTGLSFKFANQLALERTPKLDVYGRIYQFTDIGKESQAAKLAKESEVGERLTGTNKLLSQLYFGKIPSKPLQMGINREG